MPALPIALALACLAVRAPVDDPVDLRDRVVLTTGEELSARVVRPHGADVIEILVGDERRLVPRTSVLRTSTVEQRLASWLELARPGLPIEREWELVGLAEAAELHATARLQAHRVLLLEPDHAEAHAFLGHEGKPGRWRYRIGDKLVSHEKWLDAAHDEDMALAFASEHWIVRCDAGPARALEICFDLERLYVAFDADLGAFVDARTVLEPMEAHVRARPEDFRPLSSLRLSYYDPGYLLGSTAAQENALYTWYEPGAPRPERLIDLATQQLVYSSVLGDRLRTVPRDTTDHREAACLEVGLGDWFERRWDGPAGYGAAGPWRPDRVAAELALTRARTRPLELNTHELVNLVHVSWGRLIQVRDENELYWAKCRTFVAFLMENGAVLPPGGPASTREAVFGLVRRIYGRPTGNTSKAWDEVLGVAKLEELERPWRLWLELLP